MRSSHVKPSRNQVNLSGSEISRGWRKHLGKSKDEIEAAIGKVGSNAESVMKELDANGYKDRRRERA
jgi:Protein of unknown function (DUF3606)